MATLQELQSAIDNGAIVERNAHLSTGYFIKHLVYKEGEEYVFAEFDTRVSKPGVSGFDSLESLIEKVCIITPDKGHWFQTKKEVPHKPSGAKRKFFYLWLTTWCEQWRKEKSENTPVMEFVNDEDVACDFCKGKKDTYRWKLKDMSGTVCESCIIIKFVNVPGTDDCFPLPPRHE
jgi:hypothetical protein